MTVNERLYEAGLMDDFYISIKEKNMDKAVSILKVVGLTDDLISPVLEFNGLHS